MYLQKYRRWLKIVERIIEVKAQQTDNEVEIWRWLLALLNLYGAEGMSLDETDVEGMETVYRVKILVWRRNIDKYLDCIDNERKLPHQALFSRSGSKPTNASDQKMARSPCVMLFQDSPLSSTMPSGLKTRTNNIAD